MYMLSLPKFRPHGHASEQFSVKLNYVERGLSRLFGGHGELPCDVL